MDGEASVKRPQTKASVSAYKPSKKTARPTGAYSVPQGKYSAKVKGGKTWD